MSFSGLKTAVLTLARREPATDQRNADIAREFERAIVDVLVAKALAALDLTRMSRLVVAGGVGANRALRNRLVTATAAQGVEVYFPDTQFCTDNGAMIALVGALRMSSCTVSDYAFTVRPRWELASMATPQTGSALDG
jgi:N6-L-threonylcarbamoyladenine synthase